MSRFISKKDISHILNDNAGIPMKFINKNELLYMPMESDLFKYINEKGIQDLREFQDRLYELEQETKISAKYLQIDTFGSEISLRSTTDRTVEDPTETLGKFYIRFNHNTIKSKLTNKAEEHVRKGFIHGLVVKHDFSQQETMKELFNGVLHVDATESNFHKMNKMLKEYFQKVGSNEYQNKLHELHKDIQDKESAFVENLLYTL